MAFGGKTQFPGGGSNDRAILNRFYNFPGMVGNVLFVSSATGSSSGPGFSPESAYATLNQAVAAATADNGDVILLCPGHVENITAAGGVNINVAGVTVIGLGTGRQRAKYNYTTSANASFDITAARVSVQNVTFTGTGVAAVSNMVNVKTAAADCTIQNCEFEHANATNQAANVILTDSSADRLQILNCHFHGSANAGTNSAISLVGGDSIRVVNCNIFGSYHASNGVILNSTTDCTNIYIGYCNIINRTAVSTKVIVLTASSTGHISDNNFAILSGTAPITAAALDGVGGNYYKAAVGVSAGTLI